MYEKKIAFIFKFTFMVGTSPQRERIYVWEILDSGIVHLRYSGIKKFDINQWVVANAENQLSQRQFQNPSRE